MLGAYCPRWSETCFQADPVGNSTLRNSMVCQRQLKRFMTLAASFLIIKFFRFLFVYLLFAFNSLTIWGCNSIIIAKIQVEIV